MLTLLRTVYLLSLLSVIVAAGPSLAEPRERPDRDSDRASKARDTATLITRAGLSAHADETDSHRALKRELQDTHELWRRALLSLANGSDDGTLALVSAQCTRLETELDNLATTVRPSARGRRKDHWGPVRAALPRLAAHVRELESLAGDPRQAARAAVLLAEIGGPTDPNEVRLPPTMRSPLFADKDSAP